MSNKFDLQRLIRPNVAKLTPYSSAREEFKMENLETIFLDANENPYDTELNRYPDPQQLDVKSELAKSHNITTDNVLLGNGSDEILDLLIRAFCEPATDAIIILPPTYGMYGVLAETNNIEIIEILLGNDFEPKVDAILERVTSETKLIFLCSPNNPTGNSFSEEKIETILNSFKGLVVIDEAYIEFSNSESWISRSSQYSNLVVIRTFSKAYGLAGIRLGACYASSEIISVLKKIKPPYNVNTVTQRRALHALANRKKLATEVEEIKVQRMSLMAQFEDIRCIVKIYHSDANFILVAMDDARHRYHQLLAAGVVVRYRGQEPLCKNTLRITIGNPAENKKLIQVLKRLKP